MTQIVLSFDDGKVQELESDAQQLGVSIEDLVCRGVEEYIARKRRIRESGKRMLSENAELYRRLAQ
jgi:hypothetical protein